VSIEYRGIFPVFLFKSGHYVHPNGKIYLIDSAASFRANVSNFVHEVCSLEDLEAAIAVVVFSDLLIEFLQKEGNYLNRLHSVITQ
jgi:hypothetical protein